jgi:hypothetical protein
MTPKPTSPTGRLETPQRIPRAKTGQTLPIDLESHVREVVDTLNALDAAQDIINLLAIPEGEELLEARPRPDLEAAARSAVKGLDASALRKRACDLIEFVGVEEIAYLGSVAEAWCEVVVGPIGVVTACLLPLDHCSVSFLDHVGFMLSMACPETRVTYYGTHDGSLLVRSWWGGAGIEAPATSHCLTAYLDQLVNEVADAAEWEQFEV